MNKTPALLMPLPADLANDLEAGKLPALKGFTAPTGVWIYRDDTGAALFAVVRFDPPGGKKTYRRLGAIAGAKGAAWSWKATPAEPRPLYNLHLLATHPSAVVIVCEGEKAADAAGKLYPDHVATTCLNGAQSPHLTDWSTLKGRTVWIWPDHDAAGQKFAAAVAQLAHQAGAAHVSVVDVVKTFGEQAPGFDAADMGNGVAPVFGAVPAENHTKPAEKVDSPKGLSTPKHDAAFTGPNFRVNDQGVFYIPTPSDKDDEPTPQLISSRVDVIAVTRDQHSEGWGRLLHWNDPSGIRHEWSMPLESLQGDGLGVRQVLARGGVLIAAGQNRRNRLTEYLTTTVPTQYARCVEQTGWHGGVYVLPREIIGKASERIVYQSAAESTRVRMAGTLASWQAHVGRLCVGNSRLVFSVSTALAGPLLELAGVDGGGVHWFGASSDGKSTVADVACSAYGHPKDVRLQWRTTSNGVEGVAQARNDGFLVLDEVAESDAASAAATVYMLANGTGKVRARRDGTSRPPMRWRLSYVSTGEISLAQHVNEGKSTRAKAGHQVRLVDIPANAGKGFGAFETIHGYDSAQQFADAIRAATSDHCGHLARAFIQHLTADPAGYGAKARAAASEFVKKCLPADASGQARRVAERFGLAAYAGELATELGLTGWPPNEALRSAAVCLKAWLNDRGGLGNMEDRAILEMVAAFLGKHGEGRFTSASSEKGIPPRGERSGWYRDQDDPPVREWLILPAALDEMTPGYARKQVKTALTAAGWLQDPVAKPTRLGNQVVRVLVLKIDEGKLP